MNEWRMWLVTGAGWQDAIDDMERDGFRLVAVAPEAGRLQDDGRFCVDAWRLICQQDEAPR